MRTARAFAVTMILFGAACGSSSSNGREYALRGQVLALAADRKEASIKHQDIEGFMPAMTMSYKVQDPKEYEPFAIGDLLTATLVITDNDAYLKDLKKVGSAPLEQAAAQPPMAAPGFEMLKLGQPVPPVNLINQDGQAVTLDTFRGSALVVTFIYTNCPMPEFCPLMDKRFAAIQERLKSQNNLLKVHLLSVSFDPVVDTPPILKKHAQSLGTDPRLWSFATGDRDEIDRWAAKFGVSVSRAINDPINITHNLRTVIIDRQGNLVQSYSGAEWTPEQVLADVRVMVGID